MEVLERSLPLVDSNQICFSDHVPASLALDIDARRILLQGQVFDGKREQPEIIMV